MKRTLYIIGMLLTIHSAYAQKAEPVYSFVTEMKSPDWYKQQIKAWKTEIEKDKTNGLAWYYYYYATRNLHKTDPSDTRADTLKSQERQKLVDQMGKAIPNSYEYHLCMYKEHANDPEYDKHLQKVYELGEDRIEHIDQVINDAVLSRDIGKRNEALVKKWKAGLLSPGMANYNMNVLKGLSENAILITVGDNDTYPAWFVQAQGIRPDVQILNTSLLMVDSYREAVCKELGIENITINWGAKPTDPDHVFNFNGKLINALKNNEKGYDVYIGATAMGNKSLIEEHEDSLYLVGLAYKYCSKIIDEKAIMRRNYEQNYSLDYLLNTFYLDKSEWLVKQVNQNYLVSMFKLYSHYHECGDMQKKEWIKAYIVEIAKGTESEEKVKELLNQ